MHGYMWCTRVTCLKVLHCTLKWVAFPLVCGYDYMKTLISVSVWVYVSAWWKVVWCKADPGGCHSYYHDYNWTVVSSSSFATANTTASHLQSNMSSKSEHTVLSTIDIAMSANFVRLNDSPFPKNGSNPNGR